MKLASSFLMKVLCKFFKNSFSRFIVSGLCTTFVDFVIYMILSTFITISIAKIISMLSASALSFFLNKKFTFNDKQKTGAILLVRFYVVFALNVFANVGFNYLCFVLTGRKIFSFVVATSVGMLVNYSGQKIFVFKHNDK